MKIKKNQVDRALLGIYMYFVVFLPPFLPYMHVLVPIFSLGMIFLKCRNVWKSVLTACELKKWLFCWLIIYVWWSISFVINVVFLDEATNEGHYWSLFNRYTIFIFSVLFDALFLFSIYKKNGYGKSVFIETLTVAGMIESGCAVAAYVSPQIKSLFINIMSANVDDAALSNTWFQIVRCYGFASTLVDLFGLGVAIIGGVSFIYGLLYKRRYIIYSIFVSISTLLNSRSGLLLYAFLVVTSLVYVAFINRKLKNKFWSFLSAFIIIASLYILIKVVSKNDATSNWIINGLESMKEVITTGNSNSEYGSVLVSSNYWRIPEGIQIIIGTGHSLFNAVGYQHSDNGYINELWTIGLIGLLMLYIGCFLRFIIKFYKNAIEDFDRICLIILVIAYAIFNVKAVAIAPSSGGISLFLTMFAIGYFQNNELKQKVSRK